MKRSSARIPTASPSDLWRRRLVEHVSTGYASRNVARSPFFALNDPIDDGALRKQLVRCVRDADVRVDDLLPALQYAPLREDILADGARQIIDVDAHGRAE